MNTVTPLPGDIFVTTIHGRVGAGIGLAESVLELVERWKAPTDTVWRHAGVYVGKVGAGAGMVVEAEPGAARKAGLDEYVGDPLLWLRCPDQYRDGVTGAALSLVGTGYSFLDYAAITLHALHVPAPGLRGYIRSSGHWMCSALVDHAAMLGGWHLFDDGRWEGYVTPVDLALLAAQQA